MAFSFFFLKTFKIHDSINYKVEHFNINLHIFTLFILEIGPQNIARKIRENRGKNHTAGLHVVM